MTVSPQWVSAGAAVCSLGITLSLVIISRAFGERDRRIDLLETELKESINDSRNDDQTLTNSLKVTHTNLFERIDRAYGELADYKLHVAETYVNQAALEKLLAPMSRRLERIEEDLRGHK